MCGEGGGGKYRGGREKGEGGVIGGGFGVKHLTNHANAEGTSEV